MAFPAEVQTVTVNMGPVLTAGGEPVVGAALQATLTTQVLVLSDGAILPSTVFVRTGADGRASLTLAATDSVGLDTTGFTYRISAYGVAKDVSLPAAAPAVDVEGLVEVPASTGTVWVPPGAFATQAQGALATTALQPDDVGTAATADVEEFATAAQGVKADNAVQPDALATYSAPLARFAWKVSNGLPVTVVALGDSILEGNTAATPGTDDAVSLLRSEWAAEHGVEVTKANQAVSGRTAHTVVSLGDLAAALALAGDLYVIGLGHNDLRSDAATPGTGYPKASMVRQMEAMVRAILDRIPGAEIVLLLQNPYTPAGNTSNPYLEAQNALLRPLAAAYGLAVADAYAAFIQLGDFSALMADTGHPNSAGHRLIADTIKALVPPIGSAAAAATPSGDKYGGARFPAAWETRSAVNTTPDLAAAARYVVSGAGWSSGTTAPHTSSSAGNLIRAFTFGDEAVINAQCGAGQGVITIEVDANKDAYVVDLATYPSGPRNIPLVGLGSGSHLVVVVVTSGSVTINSIQAPTRIGYSLPLDGANVVRTGAWTVNTSNTSFPTGKQLVSSTLGDSLSVTFFGTALVLAHNAYPSNHVLEVQVDASGTWTPVAVADGSADGGAQTADVVASGLPLGTHTVQIRSAGARNTFIAYDLTVLDETATGYRRDADLAIALRKTAGF